MDRRRQLRLWLLALDRFELTLRGQAGKARNAFVRKAAADYAVDGNLSNHVTVSHRKRVADTLDTHYRRVIPHFAAQSLKQVKSRRLERKAAQSLYDGLVSEWIGREALRKAQMIADTDRDDVLTAIEAGMTEGLGTAEIASNIRKVSRLTPFRAATIARTETHAAATYGSIESVRVAERELGVVMLKLWLPTLDTRTRPDHAAMAGSPAIPMGEKFVVGGVEMDRPGDPSAPPESIIACRCALAYQEAE